MTGKSKATDGALDAAGLEAACKAMCKPAGLSVWQNNMPYAEAAIRAYLASLPPPTGDGGYNADFVAEILAADAAPPEAAFDNVGDMLSALASAAPPQVEPAEGETQLSYGQKLIAEAIEDHFGERVEDYDEDVDDTSNHAAWEAFDALTNQSAELLSLRRKVEETRNATIEECARVCDAEAAFRRDTMAKAEAGDRNWPDPMPQGHKAVTATMLATSIRALAGDKP